jgi:hypothetical protein
MTQTNPHAHLKSLIMLIKLIINFDTSCCTFRFDNGLEKLIHPIYEIFL